MIGCRTRRRLFDSESRLELEVAADTCAWKYTLPAPDL
jgi:hypothetical protein